ncbi:GIY-YIG nuclease family protein [Nocardioides KLBMP 9356]|uniref:GIY-YIG nuclease family protein n=1 Tax=Nocardioides potassii TaxID=2911371 RepID=A0ABS9H8X2_9ACTN|nr:GIY-YIG nuclease family protein [Nocardioides potassii]MCF6376914.1 GIY-YIG nuclease family protein [Nocardioides potassii]
MTDTCWMPDCGRPANSGLRPELPSLCSAHGLEIARHFRAEILAEEQARLAALAQRRSDRDVAAQGNVGGRPLVYYARIGNYIKIGYSTHLHDRLRSLRADELLAIEPGGYELEQERHRQFGADRIDERRENFRGSDDLLRHVLAMREKYGLPMWATRPRTSVIRTRKATP